MSLFPRKSAASVFVVDLMLAFLFETNLARRANPKFLFR